jgi:peroxiredoxin
VSECRSKFPVAADGSRKIMKAYDAVMIPGTSYASRISYVITPDHKVWYSYNAMAPDQHVSNTLKALEAWKAAGTKTRSQPLILRCADLLYSRYCLRRRA